MTAPNKFSTMSFDKLEAAIMGQLPEYRAPQAPVKPKTPAATASANEFRAHANELDAFELKLHAHQAAMATYNESMQAAFAAWKHKLQMDVAGDVSSLLFDLAYGYAYDQHHSDGLYAIREALPRIMALVKAVHRVGAAQSEKEIMRV